MWKKYAFQPKPLNDILGTATVVIDTNVLLAAYQWRDVTVHQVLKVLQRLSEEGRLLIPPHVVKEFISNRNGRIADMVQAIDDSRSKLSLPKKKLSELVPPLEGTELFEEVTRLEEEFREKAKAYFAGLDDLKSTVYSLIDSDHILRQYTSIFEKSCYTPDGVKSDAELEREALERFKANMPPGYKDKRKNENSAGDYIVWAHILGVSNDVIFVSGDVKTDWVETGPHNKVLAARRELIEEFFEVSGKSFRFLTPKEFFSNIEYDLAEEVVEDLNQGISTSQVVDFLESFNSIFANDSRTIRSHKEHELLIAKLDDKRQLLRDMLHDDLIQLDSAELLEIEQMIDNCPDDILLDNKKLKRYKSVIDVKILNWSRS